MATRTHTGTFARQAAEDTRRVARNFWSKLRRVAGYVPFAEDALAAYYCSLDRATPFRVRGAIMAALAYFVIPADALPDFLPALGFTDDAAVITATLQLVAAHILPEHREAARRTLSGFAAAARRQ